MSRRTFIKQWNPTAPIGGRGRGGRRKKGSDPDQAFTSAYRTVHDPAVDARQGGGRDAPGPRFYSASGLTSSGIPAAEDRFRAHTLGTRGGRGGRAVQQRVGMFRNAIQSNVIFGGPSERVLRHSRRKLDRLIAPESDVPESVGEWHRSPQRNTGRRRDVYEYASEEEEDDDIDEDEERRPQPRRRPSNSRRVSDQRRDPDYDPYEFRDDEESEDEEYGGRRAPPPARQRRPTQRPPAAPSTSRAAIPYERERLRDRDTRAALPRRLFVNREEEMRVEEEEEREYRRRPDRRMDEMREAPQRGDHRAAKRPREQSPMRPPATAAMSQQQHMQPVGLQQPQRRVSKRGRETVQQQPTAVTRPPSGFGHDLDEVAVTTSNNAVADARYTPGIAQSIARRILSGLPPIRLKEDNESQSYLVASRSIISSALDRFMREDEEEGGDGSQPSDGKERPPPPENPGQMVLKALMDRTQHISLSEESEMDDDEGDSEGEGGGARRGAFENIFSRHTSPNSPVLERLFEQTMRDAGDVMEREEEEEEEVDTAQMLGLGDATTIGVGQMSGLAAAMVDPFAVVGVPSGGESSSSSDGSSSSSLFSRESIMSNRSMATVRSLAIAPVPGANFPAGSSDSNRSTGYSSDRSSMGSMGSGRPETSFNFQMSGSAAPLSSGPNYVNNNDGSFNFDF